MASARDALRPGLRQRHGRRQCVRLAAAAGDGRRGDTVHGGREAGAGDVLVIKAGEVHAFRCIGDEPLVQLDVHLSPRFMQESLG